MKKILICYYTETNYTKEVAEYIGKTLCDETHEVTIKEIKEADHLEAYDSIIIGAPVHGMRWHQNAMTFLEANKAILSDKQLVYFALGSFAYQGRQFWQKKVYKSLEKPSKIIKPIETAVFGGMIGDMPKFARKIFGVPDKLKQDQRNWTMIQAWTSILEKKL